MGMSGITATGTLRLPIWMLIIRIAILVLSLGVLIAAAYNISLDHDSIIIHGSSPPGFLVFCSIATFFILGTMLVFEFFFARFYTRIVFITLLAIDSIFWLSAWAWTARWAGQFNDLNRFIGGTDFYDRYHGSMAAAAALGAAVWVMIVVFIGFFVKACLRDGSNCGTNDAELGHQQPKMEGASTYPPPPQQQQQQQQPQYYT